MNQNHFVKMDINDLDDDGPPELISVEPDIVDDSARPKSPTDIKLPRVPITIVTGIHSCGLMTIQY